MRYIVRQKIFSLGDSFGIKDEMGNDIFMVRQQLLSFGKKLRIYDLAGNELCYIEQKLMKFMPEYDIYIGGNLEANVKKRFALFKNDFDITCHRGYFTVDGDFWAHEFTIRNNGTLIATISKQYFTFTDTYGVDIDDNYDQVSTLALAIVVDMVCHEHNE